ncbi:MAG: hypothetical protein Q9218_002275 [Villophora microphyllina]
MLARDVDLSPSQIFIEIWANSCLQMLQSTYQTIDNSAIWYAIIDLGAQTDRWSDFTEGNISIVVEPATTQDVAATVRFADHCGLPFLAVNRGHGTSSTLHTIQHGGCLINLQKLCHIQISQNDSTALIGGGVNTHEVINTLAARGKVTTTTNAGCTGLLSPGLGGDFGNFVGYLGLILDNIVDMTVVLANGDVVHVSSTSQSDLYWGMRGAGQNFGIVTEARFKVYDIPSPVWSIYELDFTNATSQLEILFYRINVIINIPQPKELDSLYVHMALDPKYSQRDPSLKLQLNYAGTAAQAREWFVSFTDLQPADVRTNESIPFVQVQKAAGKDLGSGICHNGPTRRIFPYGLQIYNTTSIRQVYDLFKTFLDEHPEFAGSMIGCEGHAVGGMKAVDPVSTAYPHRDDNVLVSFAPVYPRFAASDAVALDFADRIQGILHAGDTPGHNVTAYLNYANGDESIEAMYGYESWRLDRLRELQEKYDPSNKFRFFNPFQRG